MHGFHYRTIVEKPKGDRNAGDYYYHRRSRPRGLCFPGVDYRLGYRAVSGYRCDDQQYPVHSANKPVPVKIFVQERASFILEASIWFPIMLLVIMIGLLAGLVIYEHAKLMIEADRIVERSAYSWDNSYKQIVSGVLEQEARDGLYWRLMSDGALPFASGGMGNKIVLSIPVDQDQKLSLPRKKLGRSSTLLPSGVSGEITYENKLIEREITVRLQKTLRLPLWLHRLFGGVLTAESSRAVSDPTEYLRNIDFVRTYTGIAKESFTPMEARYLYQEPLTDGDAVAVDSHAEAARWLRVYTGGKETKFSTSNGERLIDSLTDDHTAHQAFYTYRLSNALEQADKDAELLARGDVQRVVWHFFLGTGNRQLPPSQTLLNELSARGIEVVVHEGGVSSE